MTFISINIISGNYRTIILLSLILILNSCSQSEKGDSKNSSNILKLKGYEIKTESFSVTINSTGELLSNEIVELKTPVSGNVMEIYFEEGEYVKKGELLLEIDNRSWVAQKNGLIALLSSAESELKRKKKLLEIEAVSIEEVEQSEAQIDNLKSQIEELNIKINLSKIKAPFSGKLGVRDFSPGAYLSQGEKITDLAQTKKLKVSFSIPAKYAGLAELNQEIKIIPSSTEDTVVAKIYAIEPSINPNSRSLGIRAIIDNEDNKLFAGDFVKVIFTVKSYNDAILVPSEAVAPELNTQVVYIFKNDKAHRTEVKTGERTKNKIQILQGLSKGDTIITTGLLEVRDGMPVEIKELMEVGI
jgi:membrane fusion protein (multidrug efflux system)